MWASKKLKMNITEIKRVAKIYKSLEKKFKGKVLCPVKVRNNNYARCLICLAGVTRIFIRENGEVIPCTYLSKKWVLGNIKKIPLHKIWTKSKTLEKYFRKMWKINQKCMQCRNREYCIGDCKALAELRFGDILMKKPPKECAYEKS